MGKIFQVTGNQNKAGVAILISRNTVFKQKMVKKDKDSHYILIKGSIHQEETISVNIHTPKFDTPKYKANVKRTKRRNKL